MVLQSPSKVRFGEFALDAGLRQLTGTSGEVHLSPKAFDLLVLLVTNSSRVLSKNELQDRLWPDTFVVETNLASLIAEVREALNDDAKHPKFVRTAHRVGYAFCSEITAADAVTRSLANFCWLSHAGQRVPLHSGENVIGRDAGSGVTIDAPSISRRHARLVVSEQGATIEDLGSKNGTFVRNERVSAAVALSDGDEVRFGSQVLRFRRQSGSSTITVAADGDE